MSVKPLPPGYTWGLVVAKSISAMADPVVDGDRFPVARGSNGRVTFTPHVRFRVHEQEPTAFVHYQIEEAKIVDGYLIDTEGLPGVYLISGFYRVSFNIEDGSIPSFDFEVTSEHTEENPLDLVTATPVDEIPPEYVLVTTFEDRIRAEEAADRAEQHKEDSETNKNNTWEYREDARIYSEASESSAGISEHWSQQAQIKFSIDPTNDEIGLIEFPIFLLSDDQKSVVVTVGQEA